MQEKEKEEEELGEEEERGKKLGVWITLRRQLLAAYTGLTQASTPAALIPLLKQEPKTCLCFTQQ